MKGQLHSLHSSYGLLNDGQEAEQALCSPMFSPELPKDHDSASGVLHQAEERD